MTKLLNLFSDRKLLIIFLIGIAFVVFHKPIEAALDNSLVAFLLSKVESTWINDLIFLLIATIFTLYFIIRFRNIVISRYEFLTFIFLFAFYTFYRVTENVWIFQKFTFKPELAYLDIIFLIFFLVLIFFLIPPKKKKEILSNSFFEDEPISITSDEDTLGYDLYAKSISTKIQDGYFKQAFAIGINGNWGTGKTTILNKIKKHLKNDDIVSIDFNPWNLNSEKAILQDFIDIIQEKLRPSNHSISDLLIQYSKKISALSDKQVQNPINNFLAFERKESLSTIQKGINDILIRMQKKLVIYIDDLDRLDSKEVTEVLRLIRKTANFHNTVFIVAYDRSYVINAINQHNSHNKEKFLEKIFQLEINLPSFEKSLLSERLVDNLKKRFPKEYHVQIEKAIIGDGYNKITYLKEWLNSVRDVNRLSNSLLLNLDLLKGEVLFEDFLRIELIRKSYPSVYELLYNKIASFFTFGENSIRNNRILVLQKLRHPNPNTDFQYKLEEYLLEHQHEHFLSKRKISKIIKLLESIFVETRQYNSDGNSHLSIIYMDKFDRYFNYKLVNRLSELEFKYARENLNSDEFKEQIFKWNEMKLKSDIQSRFSSIRKFTSKEDFEKIISGIFFFSSLVSPNANSANGYDERDLSNKLYNDENTLTRKFYNNDSNSLIKFISAFFLNAKSPYEFESEFIRFLIDENHTHFPIDLTQLRGIVNRYFKAYCDSTSEFDNHIWSLFRNCEHTEWISTGQSGAFTKKKYFLPETMKIMKDFITKRSIDSFILEMLNKDVSEIDAPYYLSKTTIEIFGDWDEFIRTLDEQDDSKWKYLKEFKSFMIAYKGNRFNRINFEFKDIPEKAIKAR